MERVNKFIKSVQINAKEPFTIMPMNVPASMTIRSQPSLTRILNRVHAMWLAFPLKYLPSVISGDYYWTHHLDFRRPILFISELL